ncbi:hypothetical protein Cs7R123_33440 [Catellatospora sp. TT07R-123]|uniref:hypothetical protein n=1 Tax=Catellatospora sp. TT07R-123 TaxID=2733863 RepID=UPI001B2B0851|nr:hypothetical protein [Catellatospora sp. TT07R-123]GHJ46002.1 hypothetical protein Cs7R123_33440 [Catellatospora sp. TT07R-123]
MRRLIAAAGIATALLALAACRSNPDIAAYVGDQKLTEQQVTELLNDYAKAQGAQPGADPNAAGPSREAVVQLFVSDQLCQRITKQQGDTTPPASPPAGTPELLAIYQRVQTCKESLKAEPVKPTEADLREVYDNGVAVKAIDPSDPNQSFDLLKAKLADGDYVSQALGKRKVLDDAAKAADVSVNPRYRSVYFPVLEFSQNLPALTAILGQPASTAVVNVPAPAPSEQAAQQQ